MRESKSAQDRAQEDLPRSDEDGTALTMAERKLQLRSEWGNDILPKVDGQPDFHYCWLSTTNHSDPIYKRLQLGYELVTATEIPELATQHRVTSGEFEGCISINEMILAKIHVELYQELMIINHHERPLEEEEYLKANAVLDEKDSSGKPLGSIEGEGIERLGQRKTTPTF